VSVSFRLSRFFYAGSLKVLWNLILSQ